MCSTFLWLDPRCSGWIILWFLNFLWFVFSYFLRPWIEAHQQLSIHIFPHKINCVCLGCVIIQEVLCCQFWLWCCPTRGQGWKRCCDQAGFPTEEELPPGSGKPSSFFSRARPVCAGDAPKSDPTWSSPFLQRPWSGRAQIHGGRTFGEARSAVPHLS